MGIEHELIGEVFSNNQGQKYEVLRVSGRKKNGTKLFRIQFIKTGYERDVEKVEIMRGKIKDRYEKSVFGVGYLGDVKMVGVKNIYSIWSGMLERCYDPDCSHYSSYGGAGIKVCDRWHCFKHFLEDFPRLDGYDEELFNSRKLFLDKDLKQQGVPKSQKVYSPETCCFVTREVNNAYRDLSNARVHFIAKSPEGEVFNVEGLRPFAKKYGLHRPIINKCLRGERTDYNGWTFELVKESNWRRKSA
ncbi:hypothetical protein MOB41_16755 [Bacillus haynesii]|uniref:hypothetical protein n=1 Tax=Bacillus haynesii TaxID=1925021 RepID=UPI00227EAB58|nr:hypothetical protein [Bacillus haynesii]MCY7780051.1 hypothetical protein [Bacillus haynesii]MEC0669668.1 hypothetical protein [Bacillus haynesii]